MFDKSKAPLYVKGTMDVWCMNPITGNLDFYTNKVTTDQLATSVNMGEITAGPGNAVAINIPDSSKINLTLTAADFSLEARQLSVGGDLAYNGIVPYIETITASSTTLSVTKTPVKPYGINKVLAFIDNDGTAYTVDPSTKAISGFTAVNGQKYCVRYHVQAASAHQLTMYSVFAPNVETVMLRLSAYTAQGSASAQSTLAGYVYIWIPRMQFGGKADAEGSQTTPATTDLSGSALSYDEAVAAGVCADSAQSKLAYMVYMPVDGATSAVTGLVIVGGAISVAAGSTIQCPVKYVVGDELIQPDYSDLTYVVTATSTATVSAAGVITGVAEGDTEITVSLASPALSVVANVSVT